jgi:hypothetical protein
MNYAVCHDCSIAVATTHRHMGNPLAGGSGVKLVRWARLECLENHEIARKRAPGVLQSLTGWAVVTVPLLIVGLGALLIGVALPWMTAGLSNDRWLRAALVR